MASALPSNFPPPVERAKPLPRRVPCLPTPEREADGAVVDAFILEWIERHHISVRDLGLTIGTTSDVAANKRKRGRLVNTLDLFKLARTSPRLFDDLVFGLRSLGNQHR